MEDAKKQYRFILIQTFQLPASSPYHHRALQDSKEESLQNYDQSGHLLADVDWDLHPGALATYGDWRVENQEEFCHAAAGRLNVVREACANRKYNCIKENQTNKQWKSMKEILGNVNVGVLIVCCVAWVLCSAFPPPSHAQDYPTKPIRVVIAGGAGSSPEIIARLLGNKMLEALGRPFVVDVRPGASGSIGAEVAARAAPDGYTLFMLTSQLSSANAMYTKLRYDIVKDFAPISLVGTTPSVLVATPSLPAASMRELIALAKSRPGALKIGNAGVGSSAHLPAVLLASMAGIDMLHVPYKDSPSGLTGTMSGEVELSFQPLPACLPMVRSGRLKALGVTGRTRTSLAADLPAISETVPGYEFMLWQGIVAPAKTPRAIISKLNAEVVKALNSQDVREQMASIGNEPIPSSPEAYAQHIVEQVEKMKEIIRLAGIKPQD